MTPEQKETVMAVVDSEGFDYAFCDYSNFEEIKDEEFHKMRVAYTVAARKLKEIIGFINY